MNHLEKMAIARTIVLKRTPYISTTLFSLVPYAKKGIGTIMTTRKMIMAYDPDWYEKLTDEEAAGALFHETQHPCRRHFSRSDDFADKRKFNIAGDLGINVDERECGYTLPEGSLFPADYGLAEGHSAEEYYDLLPAKGQPDPQDQPGEGPGQPGEGEGPGQPGGEGKQEGPGKEPPCSGNCGGASGNEHPQEQEVDAEAEAESPGATKSEAAVNAVQRAQAQEIIDYVQSHGRGSVPANLVEWATFAMQPPKISWRRKLPRILRRALGKITAGGENYSKKRISKRSFVRGYVVPGLISQKPELVIIRDTSGSMGRPQLQDVQNEVVGVLKATGVESVMFMDADADANKPRRVTVRDIPRLPITGRGGTDFGPAIAIAAKLKPRPKCIMYFTDGDGPAPDRQPPGIEFIWVIINGHYNKPPVDWGHHIFVGPEGEGTMEDDY